MNEAWVQQMGPVVDVVLEAFVHDTEAWWESGCRGHAGGSLRAEELASEIQYVTHRRPDPVNAVYTIGELSARVALDYLRGALEATLSDSLFSSFALARCSLEATARAYWLLDPGKGLEDRLLRGAQYHAWCLEEMRKAVAAAPRRELATEVAKLKNQQQRILDWTKFHGMTNKTDAKAFARSCKGFTDLVRDLVEDMPEVSNIAPIVYRWLSGTAHSNPLVLHEFGQQLAVPGDQRLLLLMGASARRVFFPAWLAARGFQMALIRLAHVNGWEDPDGFLGPAVAQLAKIIAPEMRRPN